jgi:hypothetical protein
MEKNALSICFKRLESRTLTMPLDSYFHHGITLTDSLAKVLESLGSISAKHFRTRQCPWSLPGVAGNFNSGTNVLHKLLFLNLFCGGKHAPVDFRGVNRRVKESDLSIQNNNVLSVVTIGDPNDWMNSMCRIGYSTSWSHTANHCLNLVADKRDQGPCPSLKLNKTVPVMIPYGKECRLHASLANFYSTWYTDYLKADFARVMIRM